MSYTSATFYVDDGSVSGTPGDDSARAPLSPCTASNPSGTVTRINYVGHGLTTGAVVDLTDFDSWLNEAWKITVFDADNFDLDGAVWQATVDNTGTAAPRGGSSWSDAWETISSGATASRIQPGDTIKIAKSEDPISIGGAQWTNGPIGTEIDISSSTDATPIVVTTSSNHGLSDGDYVRVYNHQTNITANGTWKIANSTLNTFELIDAETSVNSAGSGVGAGSDGKVRQINAQVVYLDTAQTITIDNCESAWTAAGEEIDSSIFVTAGGKGYTVGDILTINDGAGDATVEVLTVETTGPVLTVSVNAGGTNYAVSDVLTLSGGNGDAQVTVTAVDPMTFAVTAVTVTTAGTGYPTGVGIFTSGGSGDGFCTIDITSVDNGDVLTVQLDTQTVLGGYTSGSGKTTTGAGTGCTLQIFVNYDSTVTLQTPSSQSPQSAFHVGISSNVAAVETCLAYKTISLTDFSVYDAITLWVNTNSGIGTDEFSVRLCSDTSGQTTVDTFKIPALLASQKWFPLTIPSFLGGPLGAAIQSIALYSGTSIALSSNILLDNISACNSSGLSLQTLITKNGAAFGGSEYRYAIESISGRVVMLAERAGNSQFIPSGTGPLRGYIGTTENVTTYIRKPIIKTVTSGAANALSDDGSFGSVIVYSGGWDAGTDTQDGLTIYDGQTGSGYGIYCENKFNSLTRFEVTRYERGIYFSNALYNLLSDFTSTHCYLYGAYLTESDNNTIASLKTNHCGTGINVLYCSDNTVESLSAVNCVNAAYFGSCLDNVIETGSISNCNYGVIFSESKPAGNQIQSCAFIDCVLGIWSRSGHNYGRDLTFSGCAYDILSYSNYTARFDSKRHNGTGQNYIYDLGVETISAPTTRPGGSGLMWGTSLIVPPVPGDNPRTAGFPFYLPIAQIPVEANLLVTTTLWMLKSHATDIEASFICKGNQIAGVSTDVEVTKAADTNWEEVTITFTPTERGVVEVGAKVWLVSNAPQTVYIDDITINQAV